MTAGLDRNAMLDWYRRNRVRSAGLFDTLAERVYATRPIALRNPIVFCDGHLPGFSVHTLITKGLGRPGVDALLEEIFARGIDPEDEALASPRGGVRRDIEFAARYPSLPCDASSGSSRRAGSSGARPWSRI